MRTIFLVMLILALLFLVLAGACSLAGFSQIGKDEEKEKEHFHDEVEGIKERAKHKMQGSPSVKENERITFHEEEDGI